MTEKTTSCFIAIVGKPNVGKSSLLNAIVGSKIAIVSDKPQTTRTRIMGVHTEGNLQLVFTDTPGQHRSHNKLDEYMRKSIREAMSGVDACVFVTEPEKEITDAEKSLLKRLKRDETPTVLVINKIDTLKDKAALLSVIDMWQKAHDFAEILPLSALTGEGIDALLEALKGYAFESPHFFPDDALTDQPERVIAAELIREKLLLSLQHEVPHGIAVVIESWHERETTAGDPIVDAEATIYCEREGHKGIVIGKRGAMLQKIGTAARKDLEEMLGVRVNLQCWVKVREDWRNNEFSIRDLGFN